MSDTPNIPEGFTPWAGGDEPPVSGSVIPYYRFGGEGTKEVAAWLRWDRRGTAYDIIAYRTVTP